MTKKRAKYVVNDFGDIFFCAKDGTSLGAMRKNNSRIELFGDRLRIYYTELRIPQNVTREETLLRIFNGLTK